MKITFTKTVKLYTATVYMKIKKNVPRPDIQEYLNGKRFNDHLVNNRINDYLKEIRIYDETYNLRPEGEAVKETGYLPTPEEGKYRIWYTYNDEYFGNKIMYFRRETPNDKSIVERMDVYFKNEDHFLMPAREHDKEINHTRFSLLESQLYGKVYSNDESITATLIMQDGKETLCAFSGKIGKDGATELDHRKTVHRDDKIEDLITEIIPDYDTRYKRLKVSFNATDKTFVAHRRKCKWKHFDGEIDSVDLMPRDLENAIRWRDSLVKDLVAQQYLSPLDFQSKVMEVNKNPAFEKYYNQLNVQESKDFHTETFTEFWHLNAPIDLNPDKPSNNISETITVKIHATTRNPISIKPREK